MAFLTNEIDSAFHAAGAKPGLEIWCVQNLHLIPLPKSLHGNFYSGNAYLVLNNVLLKNGPPEHDVHYWIGKDANEAESAFASEKALELDSALGSCTVQYREVQGEETEKFLSYFKPCIIPIEGVYSSQSRNFDGESYKVTLLNCKGDHAVSVKEVHFSRSSLNHNDVFILDTASKIFLFSGCNSSLQERAKALDVVQYVKDTKHGGKCEVATIEDGKFVGDSDVGEFWSLFGGYAPIPRDPPSGTRTEFDASPVQLFWITWQGNLCPNEGKSLNKTMLDSSKCYMLDCGAESFVWMGRNTNLTEKKTSISVIEGFLRDQGRSTATHLTFLTEGLETSIFRSYFESWPKVEPKLYEEGRGKVAAIFKQQGYDVQELPDDEDYQSYIDCEGKLQVWRVSGDDLIAVSAQEQTKIYSGDCYIVQYTYAADGRKGNLFYAWIGRESVLEDRVDVICHMNAIADSTKGDSVLAKVFQDKEPLQLFSILRRVIVYKGGLSKRYKELIAEEEILDETYDEGKTALFRVQGTSPNSMQAIQVVQASSSLNSSYCYILKTGTSTFSWIGNLSSTTDHDLLDRMLELVNPTWQLIILREGSEPDIFWEALGGKTEYPREKEIKQHNEEPHLFTFTLRDDDFKVKEIYSFTQDDLTTEDVLILNCDDEIYVWIGCHSNVKFKHEAFTLGLKFLQTVHLVEGLSLETPIYIVTEGQEPPFFTRYFEWDHSKANMHGNSFERKLAIVKGNKQSLEVPTRKSWKASSRDSTPDGLRRNSVSPNGRGRSVSHPSGVSGSYSKSSNKHHFSSLPPTARKLFSSPHGSNGSQASSQGDANLLQVNPIDTNPNSLVYPFVRLRLDSSDPVTDIDVTKREAYLSEEEFQERFGMSRQSFYQLPNWKQNKLKISLHLF
ncbi:villin-1 isoform X2 [Euphorbia lathyris]|uniref:villin-1 isoform X2 n=1 Tax=Euphorbia lathyris TaxID=212925 RepID=UPI0033131954